MKRTWFPVQMQNQLSPRKPLALCFPDTPSPGPILAGAASLQWKAEESSPLRCLQSLAPHLTSQPGLTCPELVGSAVPIFLRMALLALEFFLLDFKNEGK